MVKSTPQWQSTVTIFSKYAIPGNEFKIKLFKGIHVVVSAHCNTIGKPRFIAKRSYKICESCFTMNHTRTTKLAQTVRERSLTISRAIDLTKRNIMTATDYKTAQDIANRSSRVHYSEQGQDLIDTIKGQINYYQSVQACPVKQILCEQDGNVLGQDAFI
jgi:hypothetical protein